MTVTNYLDMVLTKRFMLPKRHVPRTMDDVTGHRKIYIRMNWRNRVLQTLDDTWAIHKETEKALAMGRRITCKDAIEWGGSIVDSRDEISRPNAIHHPGEPCTLQFHLREVTVWHAKVGLRRLLRWWRKTFKSWKGQIENPHHGRQLAAAPTKKWWMVGVNLLSLLYCYRNLIERVKSK